MSNAPGAGLSDIIVGSTAISTVGVEGAGLSYRGYSIADLASKASFEEVAYLLLEGHFPNKSELAVYREQLMDKRRLPVELKIILEQIPKSAHPMDVLRTGTSALGCIEPETDFSKQKDIANRLLAIYPAMLMYWYRYHFEGKRIDTQTAERSIGGHFLALLKGRKPTELEVKVMNSSLILYAEHEYNASTFAARVAASTLTDFYSAVTAAIGTLRGPLHGGANEAAMLLIQRFKSVEEVAPKLGEMLASKEKIMGFGHRVYNEGDPRSPIIKEWSLQLAAQVNDTLIFPVSEAIESVMWNSKKLFPNLDFYSASTYYFMNIPISLYTPIFVCSRITGWAAHIFEQRANNALIRPSAEYTGPAPRDYLPIGKSYQTKRKLRA